MRSYGSLILLTAAMAGCQCKPTTTPVIDGELRASPTSLEFGQTWLGTRRPLTLTVSNTGRTPRTLIARVDEAAFEIPDVIELGGGEAREIPIVFAATRTSRIDAHLLVGDSQQTLDVPLAGEGLAIPACTAGPCETSSFSTDLGRCVTAVVADDTPCSPGCEATGICVAGTCRQNSAGRCDDGNACTIDACGADGGCLALPKTCPVSGACMAATCDSATGCTESPVDDGVFCGEPLCASVPICVSGTCQPRATPDADRQCTYVDVSAHAGATCAKTVAGTTRCWGYSGRDELQRGYPTWSAAPGPLQIGFEVAAFTGGNALCVMDAVGHLVCPGLYDGGAERFTSIKLDNGLCGVLVDGGLLGCRSLPDAGYALLTPATRVWGNEHGAACLEKSTGEIGCWGFGRSFSTTTEALTMEVLPLSEPPRSMALSENVLAVQADGGARVFGAATTELSFYPVRQTAPWLDAVVTGGRVVYGHLGDLTVEVCAVHFDGGVGTRTCSPLGGQHTFSKITAGSTHGCGLEDGGVWCWGGNETGQLGEPALALAPHAIEAGGAIFVEDQVWLNDGGVRSSSGVTVPFVTRNGALDDVCGSIALSDGALFIGGQQGNDAGFTRLQPQYANDLFGTCEGIPRDDVLIARTGRDVALWRCSLWADAGVTCEGRTDGSLGFGLRDAGVQMVAATSIAVPPAVAIRSTYDSTCSLGANGQVWCWGDSLGKPVPAQLPLLGVRQLECGNSHCCALAGENNLKCWGSNFANQLGMPGPGSTIPRSIAIGGSVLRLSHHAQCVVLRSGAAICWGERHVGAPARLETPQQVIR